MKESKIRNTVDLIAALRAGRLKEHLHTNLELKSSWSQDDGEKISSLANKISELVCFFVVGVADNGIPVGINEKQARSTEQVVSQHINNNLSPVQSCQCIECLDVDGNWILVLTIKNVGEVTNWNNEAYSAAGTSTRKLDPGEVLALRMQLPGLTDYSRQNAKSVYDENLVLRFAEQIRSGGYHLEVEITGNKANSTLAHLGIYERQAARILFGKCFARLVKYDENNEPQTNQSIAGLYAIVEPKFVDIVARSGKNKYSPKAIREAFANAVAHAAYFERDGEIIIEEYDDRLVISNLCLRESTAFANKWFSRSHKSVNALLMESLRVSKTVDELGRGKSIIFAESIKCGFPPPEVIIEPAGMYMRWKLVIHSGSSDSNLLRIYNRSHSIFKSERKALIAQALVLWRDKPVKEIKQYVDDEFRASFNEVIENFDSPVFYSPTQDKIYLRRWASVLLGEGKDSKDLSAAEEERIIESLRSFLEKTPKATLTPGLLRIFASMGDSKAERSLCSRILARWVGEGKIERVGHGKYKFSRGGEQRTLTGFFDMAMQALSEGGQR